MRTFNRELAALAGVVAVLLATLPRNAHGQAQAGRDVGRVRPAADVGLQWPSSLGAVQTPARRLFGGQDARETIQVPVRSPWRQPVVTEPAAKPLCPMPVARGRETTPIRTARPLVSEDSVFPARVAAAPCENPLFTKP